MEKVHPSIWELIIKSYNHAHDESYLSNLVDFLPLSVDRHEEQMLDYLTNLPFRDALIIIQDALEDSNIKRMDRDNWNYYGDCVKFWRGRIITCLD